MEKYMHSVRDLQNEFDRKTSIAKELDPEKPEAEEKSETTVSNG